MRICLSILLFLSVCKTSVAYDEFSDLRAPAHFSIEGSEALKLVLKGQWELSWRDIEGAGGAAHDSISDTVTLGTRSGHAGVDGLRLAFRVEAPEHLAFYSAFLFDPRGARAEGAWLDSLIPLSEGLTLHTEAGLHTPLASVDDYTSRAPMTARIYWGQPEMHLSTKLLGSAGRFRWWLGTSLGLMRPLDAELVNDASHSKGTLVLLSYGAAEVFSGNQAVFGGTLGLGYGPLQFEFFGSYGQLSAERGTDELRNRMANFALLPGYNSADPRSQDSSFWWGGGRVDFAWAGIEARVEWIESRESLIRRAAGYAQAGYVWFRPAQTTWLKTLELRFRIERYRIHQGGETLRVVDPSQALTWDFDVVTASLCTLLYRDLLRLYLEYSLIEEHNGAPASNIADVPVANNETTLQLELRF